MACESALELPVCDPEAENVGVEAGWWPFPVNVVVAKVAVLDGSEAASESLLRNTKAKAGAGTSTAQVLAV